MVAAVIVAAGAGRRMGFDKLAAALAGRPVLAWSVAAFEGCGAIDRTVVVGGEDRRELLEAAAPPGGWRKLAAVVPGGEERHHSVANGLAALPAGCELVAVHDGARPLVSAGAIGRVVMAARQHGAASLARPVAETVKRADAGGFVSGAVDRAGLWVMETPQVFRVGLLREAYEEMARRGAAVTDEVSAVAEFVGHPVFLVDTGEPNVKITFPPDLAVAEALGKLGGW